MPEELYQHEAVPAISHLPTPGQFLAVFRQPALITDSSYCLRLFNEPAGSVLGLSEKHLGAPLDEAVRCAAAERGEDGVRLSDQAVEGDEELTLAVRIQLAGRAIPGIWSIAPMGEGSGSFRLHRFEETAERSQERLGVEFLANVTHELRTPLSAMVATTELMLQDYQTMPSTELGQMISLLHRNTRRLESMVSNLLDAASIQDGKLLLRKSVVNSQSLVRDAADFVLPLLNSKNQRLETRTMGPAPALVVDSKRITGVLVNLLSNASRYGLPNERIQLIVSSEGTIVRFTVRQKGPGIPKDEQAMLFQRFYRTSDGAKVVGGSGLGLAIVKDIVEMHGGTVGMVSKPGTSTAFWFTIPVEGAVT